MDIVRSGIDRVGILTSWVLVFGYILRVFVGIWAIICLRIFYFGQVVFKVLGGIRVEFYASGGATVALLAATNYKIYVY